MGHLNELPINLDKLLDDSTTDSCPLKKRTFLQNMTSTANTFFIAGGINITTSIWTDEEAISREMISETIRKFFKDAQPKLSNTHRYAKNSRNLPCNLQIFLRLLVRVSHENRQHFITVEETIFFLSCR
jgi:hypothetical protein